ncbi:MAG: ACP S-malonyltransferase [Bacillota bacterium]|nr:ACP S-malonyltransferase [Bacillota bacterium]MDD3297495.1 ACP S-malonyltransferase [Bacillota bacterium]MDD3850168.1 ACP S-malonyltransferase [Bacillota bacterium]MDD4706891.1 ACP S-malonyltransferase [Bacillota bacterium]
MGKVAFIFPGQGAQYIGMGKYLCQNLPEAKEVFDSADRVLGFGLKRIIFEGPEERLSETEITQPAILTISTAILRQLKKHGIKPDMAAGLSLGEYSALVAADSMDFEDAVALVQKRGKYMQSAVPINTGTMAAIIGLDKESVEECCRRASHLGVVEPANYNCSCQTAISGERGAVAGAVEIAKEMGARRAVILPVSAPFHCSLLRPVEDKLGRELDKMNIRGTSFPVIANVTAMEETRSEYIKQNLIKQVSSPVLWEESVIRMLSLGADTFVEIGPGKTLSGFVKKIDKGATIMNIENMETLEMALKVLEGIKCLS